MTTILLHQRTTATPEQFLAGLTDFGPGREKIFGRSADGYLKVHSQSPGHADVTEGSGGVWERLEYDWTDPHHVRMKTIDSNTWGGKSGHVYHITTNPDGTTEVDATVVRDGKNFKGHAVEGILGVFGKRLLGKQLAKTARAIEARHYEARAR
jgi:hypothetical protein